MTSLKKDQKNTFAPPIKKISSVSKRCSRGGEVSQFKGVLPCQYRCFNFFFFTPPLPFSFTSSFERVTKAWNLVRKLITWAAKIHRQWWNPGQAEEIENLKDGADFSGPVETRVKWKRSSIYWIRIRKMEFTNIRKVCRHYQINKNGGKKIDLSINRSIDR